MKFRNLTIFYDMSKISNDLIKPRAANIHLVAQGTESLLRTLRLLFIYLLIYLFIYLLFFFLNIYICMARYFLRSPRCFSSFTAEDSLILNKKRSTHKRVCN